MLMLGSDKELGLGGHVCRLWRVDEKLHAVHCGLLLVVCKYCLHKIRMNESTLNLHMFQKLW